MTNIKKSTYETKIGLAKMLEGGVIMDVVNETQAKIAEDAGACAVMALERVPIQIRTDGGVARASDPLMIKAIQKAVSIPVMAKCRIGHFVEAQILESLKVDFIDESEVLTPADNEFHIDKKTFNVPFVCGCRDLGEALRRINEGATLIRTKGEAGTGNIVEAVKHLRSLYEEIQKLTQIRNIFQHYSDIIKEKLEEKAQTFRVPYELVESISKNAQLPVPNFAAGGIATPADAALCMALGAQSVFVGSGIFMSEKPEKRAKAIVEAVTYWKNPDKLAEISSDIGDAIPGIEIETLSKEQRLSTRGW